MGMSGVIVGLIIGVIYGGIIILLSILGASSGQEEAAGSLWSVLAPAWR